MTGVPTRILVPVTVPAGSEEAVVAAVALAVALGAELVLAGIAPLAPPEETAGWPPNVSPLGEQVERQRLIDRLVGARLEELAAGLPAGLDARTVLAWGPVGEALVATAREQRADLVVVPMRQEGELRHLMHDHADRHVLHHSDVPVLVVPTHGRQPSHGWAA
jgi:nucleotide-binding universal stress UspA family protein